MREYDLEERLLEFAAQVIGIVRSMPRFRAATHIADQLLRAGTSPYGQHGEAEGAESPDDFIHKLRCCYKELREARRWLRLVKRVPLIGAPESLEPTIQEADELVRIFYASIRTAGRNREQHRRGGSDETNIQHSTFNIQRGKSKT